MTISSAIKQATHVWDGNYYKQKGSKLFRFDTLMDEWMLSDLTPETQHLRLNKIGGKQGKQGKRKHEQ